jgi:hypothetical protein
MSQYIIGPSNILLVMNRELQKEGETLVKVDHGGLPVLFLLRFACGLIHLLSHGSAALPLSTSHVLIGRFIRGVLRVTLLTLGCCLHILLRLSLLPIDVEDLFLLNERGAEQTTEGATLQEELME